MTEPTIKRVIFTCGGTAGHVNPAIALAQLKQELAHLTEPVFLVGDGSVLTYKTLSGDIPNLIMPPEHRMHQRAAGVALLAAQKEAAGETGDGAALTPNYLRLSQAERERLEKQLTMNN